MREFKRIYIEITNVCNLTCQFCPKTSRKSEFMELALFKKILEEVKTHTRYIYFHVMGEPLLHPDIDVFLDHCYQNGCKVNITTNGTLIKETRKKLFGKKALQMMNFSLHIFDENTSEIFIDKYLEDAINFIEETAAANPDFIGCFRLWNLDSKSNKLEEKNLYILKKLEKYSKASCRIEDIPQKGNGIKLTQNICINQATCFNWPDINLPDMDEEGFCLGLRKQAAILVDGTIVPCCLDREGIINLGNIKESDFMDIIRGERAGAIYDGFSERRIVEALCRKCDYRKRFN